MKKVLQNTEKAKKYLDSLPKIYMIGVWTKCGVREYPFSGKCDNDGVPLVYDYVDLNGELDEFHLMRLTNTTTGQILAWTTSKNSAEKLAQSVNYSANYSAKSQHFRGECVENEDSDSIDHLFEMMLAARKQINIRKALSHED